MKKILTGLLVLVLFAAVFGAGCVGADPSIAGTWQWEHEDGDLYDLVYTFNEDNTFTETWYTAGTDTVEMSYDGVWSETDGEYRIFYSNGDELIEGATVFTLSKDGKALTDGLEIQYFRK